MAKNRSGKRHVNDASQPSAGGVAVEATDVSRPLWLVTLAAVLLATVVCYLPVFDSAKEFTNWDDNIYVSAQPLVKDFAVDSIPSIFATRSHVASNYHPLTILSLGLTKSVFGLSARAFAGVNVVFHILNTALVFALAYMLSRRRLWVAGLAALWFGIHPMHVESVAWISERKDVLYAFFLLLSLLAYVRYVTTGRMLMLGLAFIAFIASCLSKAMAVPLAVALLLVDHWYDRKFTVKVLLEKLPFFLVAVIIGWLAISIQSQVAIADFDALTMPQRIAFTSYGFVMYWVKIFVPKGLGAFYPYPALQSTGDIASWYYLMPVVALALIVLPVVVLRKNADARKTVIFGMGFFVLFVALVLQFLQVGNAIMADRYTYVPYIGSFFLLAVAADHIVKRLGRGVGMGLVALSLVLVPISYAQVGTWRNSETLWTRVIELHPVVVEGQGNTRRVIERGAPLAYAARGYFYYLNNRLDEAFVDLERAEAGGESNPLYLQILGVLYGQRGDRAAALRLLQRADRLRPGNAETLYNLGITHAMLGDSPTAVSVLEKAISAEPDTSTTENILEALIQENYALGRMDAARSWCDRTIASYPSNALSRYLKGVILMQAGRYREALEPLAESVRLEPSNKRAWYNLALVRQNLGDMLGAQQAMQKAGGTAKP